MISDEAQKLGEALVAANFLTPEQLATAMETAKKGNYPSLVIALLDQGFLTFKAFEKFIQKLMGIKSSIISGLSIPEELVRRIGLDFIHSHFIMPIASREVNGVSSVALGMVDPTDTAVIKKVESHTGFRIIPVLISLPDFRVAAKKFPQAVELQANKEDFELIRPSSPSKEKTETPLSQDKSVTHTVQPKPSMRSEVPLYSQPNQTASHVQRPKYIDLIGANAKKFREEVLAKLDLHPADARKISEPTYTRENLFTQLKNVSPVTLQKVYNSLSIEAKFEALANALIAAGDINKLDLLASAAVSSVFFEEEKQ